MEFQSIQNKAMIWQLLIEANAFINIPDTYFENIKSSYEEIILKISALTNISLTERNKILISKMLEKIKQIEPPLPEVELKINEQFENKKQEFIQLVNHNKPTDISFNYELDKPFNEMELNSKLNAIITDRSYDLLQPKSKEKVEKIEKVEKVEKKILFIPSSDDIINKLKLIDTTDLENENENEIINLLKTILINQKLTLERQDKILLILSTNGIS
jgi:hypothetical protein